MPQRSIKRAGVSAGARAVVVRLTLSDASGTLATAGESCSQSRRKSEIVADATGPTMTTGGCMKIVDRPWFYRSLRTAWLVAVPGVVGANADLEKQIADPKNHAMQAGDMYNQRYNKLPQLNA